MVGGTPPPFKSGSRSRAAGRHAASLPALSSVAYHTAVAILLLVGLQTRGATGTVLPPTFVLASINATTSTEPWMAAPGDLNGDGAVDVVVATYIPGGVHWCVRQDGVWAEQATVEPEGA